MTQDAFHHDTALFCDNRADIYQTWDNKGSLMTKAL